jgi:hypothetical protein
VAVSSDIYVCLLGILQRSNPGTASSTLALIIVGPSLLISAGVHEVRTTRDALFPRAIFNDLNIGASAVPFIFIFFSDEALVVLLIVSFLHNVAFNTGTFYLTLYYQVRTSCFCSSGHAAYPYLRLSTCQPQLFALVLCSFRTLWGHPWHHCLLLGS